MSMHRFSFAPASTPEQLDTIRTLFREYNAFLDIDLCFQDFEQELAELPGKYASPHGRLYLITCESQPIGCMALRPLDEGICEVKRLFIRPEYKGFGLGRLAMLRLLADARQIGYRAMRLDTLRRLAPALRLYESLGFREISAYNYNPHDDIVYLELALEH